MKSGYGHLHAPHPTIQRSIFRICALKFTPILNSFRLSAVKGRAYRFSLNLLQCLFRRTVQLEYDEEHILIVQFLIGDAAESDVLVLHQKVFHIENRIKAVKQVIKNGKSSE